jgi:hypothetical protein
MNILKSRLLVIGCLLVGLCSPCWATKLVFGAVEKGTISEPGGSNKYTFTAEKNDVFSATMTTTSGSLSPTIELYDASGEIAIAYNDGCGGSRVEMNTITLPVSGSYYVIARDCSNEQTGTYDLYGQRTNGNPSGAAMLLYGQTQMGKISLAAQSNSYIFMGSANDVFNATMTVTSGTLAPTIELYTPAGESLAVAYNDGCGGGRVEMNTVTLPTSGVYTVLVRDCSDTYTGEYALYAQRTNSPFGPTTPFIWDGQVQSGDIASAAHSNTYTFAGSVNNTVDLTMTVTSGALAPTIELYTPAGAALAVAYNNGCGGGSVTMSSVTLPDDGIYTVLVRDCSDTYTGKYNLSGQCFGTCPAMPAIKWARPASITYGTPLSATQLDATSPVSGTFAYNPPAGTVLSEGPQNLSVIFTPTDSTEYSTGEDSVQIIVKK